MTNLFVNLKEVAEEFKTNTFMDEIVEYSAPYDLSDVIAQMADMNVSIYYNDIYAFIAEHPEYVEQAINEFGWSGDIHKASQSGEYIYNTDTMYNNIQKMLSLWAINYLIQNYDINKVPSAMVDMILFEIGDGSNISNLAEVEYIADTFYRDFIADYIAE